MQKGRLVLMLAATNSNRAVGLSLIIFFIFVWIFHSTKLKGNENIYKSITHRTVYDLLENIKMQTNILKRIIKKARKVNNSKDSAIEKDIIDNIKHWERIKNGLEEKKDKLRAELDQFDIDDNWKRYIEEEISSTNNKISICLRNIVSLNMQLAEHRSKTIKLDISEQDLDQAINELLGYTDEDEGRS
ncbi:MAG: hypothetical protein R3346_03675 [Candidatus Spechtbacterales bacterium]|nr:hypothetical protein [Candidatus Spechtbacterales bacterium]